jgi:pimeloyl-ACP methyl ester carboxylesterase
MNTFNTLTFMANEVSRDETSKVIKLTIGNLGPVNKNVDVEIKLAGNLQSNKGFAVFHGATLTYTAMEVFTGRFKDHRMIYLNAPGRGQSSEIQAPDIIQYARIYSAALHWLVQGGEIDSLTILGYSMGGLIALKTALIKEVKVDQIIMLNSTARISPDSEVSRSIHALAEGKIDADDPECLNIIPMHGFGSQTPKEFIDMVAEASVTFLAPLKWAVIDMIKTYETDFSCQLDGLDPGIRFLFISGKDDQAVLPADTQATIDELKKAGLHVESVFYEGAGHIDFLRLLDDDAAGGKGVVSTISEFIST